MWLKADKKYLDNLSDYALGEYHAGLETAIADIDAVNQIFIGKEVSDDLQSMCQYLTELSSEVKNVIERRNAEPKHN